MTVAELLDPAPFDLIDRSPDTPLEDARVLIVDDDASAANLMVRRLERDGFRRVSIIGDGRKAIAAMFDHPPEVLVLDVHMPHFDGFQVLRELQDHATRSRVATSVLAVSGDAAPATCQSMLHAGADDFLLRPFDGTEFALRVRRLARQSRRLRGTLDYVYLLESKMRDLGVAV